jgi:hypothetical protein
MKKSLFLLIFLIIGLPPLRKGGVYKLNTKAHKTINYQVKHCFYTFFLHPVAFLLFENYFEINSEKPNNQVPE